MNLENMITFIAPFIGFSTLVIGVLATLKPEHMSEKFGIKASSPTLPYVISTGVRDIFMGLTILYLFYQKNFSALGYIHLFITVVAISDFSVVFKFGNKKTALVHACGAVLAFVYGIYLISK